MPSELSSKIGQIMVREMEALGTHIINKQCYDLCIMPDEIEQGDLIKLSNRLAGAMLFFGGREKADRVTKEILELVDFRLIEKEEKKEVQITSYLEMGDIKKTLGDLEGALNYYSKALKVAVSYGKLVEQSTALRRVAAIKRRQGKWGAALDMLNESLWYAKRARDFRGEAEAYEGLGMVYWRKSNYDLSIEHFQKCIALASKKREHETLCDAYIGLGSVYEEMGAYDEAIDFYNKGIGVLSLIVKKGTYGDLTLPKIYNHMGLAYARKGDLKRAIASFQKCIEIAFQGGFNSLGAWALYNAAECYGKLNNYDKALAYCRKSYEIFDRYDDKLGLGGVTMVYALIYKLMGDPKRAEDHFKESIRLREEVGVPYMMGDAYMEYGTFLKQSGDLKKAKRYLEKALYTFMNIRNKALTERMVKEIESLESQTSYLT